MFIIAVLIVLSAICAMWTFRNNVAIVNSFRDSFQEKETERLFLITEIKEAIEQLENDVKIEMLLLKAEGQFVKPVFQNMLTAIKGRTGSIYSLTHRELSEIMIEIDDLKNNLIKKSK